PGRHPGVTRASLGARGALGGQLSVTQPNSQDVVHGGVIAAFRSGGSKTWPSRRLFKMARTGGLGRSAIASRISGPHTARHASLLNGPKPPQVCPGRVDSWLRRCFDQPTGRNLEFGSTWLRCPRDALSSIPRPTP